MKLFLLLYSSFLFAEITRDQIHIITQNGHHPLNYQEAREILFGKIFLKSDSKGYFIRDIYCNKEFRDDSGVGLGLIPNPQVLNTEHSWPKKYFSKRYPFKTQESDLFHLYPTDTTANSFRGHLEFQEVINSEPIPDCDLSKRGPDQFNHFGFEPPDNIKGDLARSLFYFSVRYEISIPDNEEQILRKWNQEDPIDLEEKIKNNLIMKAQGNRNPFIDQEDLVSQIKDF